MPCRSGYDEESELHDEIERLTAMLACALATVEKAGQEKALPPAVRSWWKEHKAQQAELKKRDAEARKLQDLKRTALAKLSPAERKALGHF